MDGQTYASLALKVADEMGIPADKVMTPEQHERFARRFYEMCAEADEGGSSTACAPRTQKASPGTRHPEGRQVPGP